MVMLALEPCSTFKFTWSDARLGDRLVSFTRPIFRAVGKMGLVN